MSTNHKKQLKKLLINTKFALQDIFKNDFFSKGEQELNNLLKESMECLLVKKINLEGDVESNQKIANSDNLEDAEIASQLYILHTKILRMFILTAFDMSRDILITPKRIMYAKEKENELYEQLMIIAKEKQQEIRMLIASTIEQMRDRLVEKAANFVFKENTIFNYSHQQQDCLLGGQNCDDVCQMNDCSDCRCLFVDAKCSEKCDSALTQSNEDNIDACWCASDEPAVDYQQPAQNQHDLIALSSNQTTANNNPQIAITCSSISDHHQPISKLRRHHSMHSHFGNRHGCCHHEEADCSNQLQQPQRANSQQNHFKHYNPHFCALQQQQQQFNTQSHNQYTSCEYADSGCASGNCCSCEPFVSSEFHHQRHPAAYRNSQHIHSAHHLIEPSSEHHQPLQQSPTKKESIFKRLTNKFKTSGREQTPASGEDYSRKVIEQLNELQIKDKQDYEDLKNHLNHLNRLNQLKQQQQQLEYYQQTQNYHHHQQQQAKSQSCCNHSVYHSAVTTPQPLHLANNGGKQIKITLKDLCAAQNEIQEYILSLLNNQIANDIVNSINILKKNYIGTLERCLTALESGVSSIAQREQLTTALTAAVEFDSPTKSSNKSTAQRINKHQKQQQHPRKRNNCQKEVINCSSYKTASHQNSLDCDCTLNSNGSSANSSFDEAEDDEEDNDDEQDSDDDDYSFANRTHHEASDALKQIISAAYQVEINLKTNSGFFKLYWDKIRQLVFNCTVTLWKLNYANPTSKTTTGDCCGATGCQSNLSLIADSKYCNSCPPIICTSMGSDARTATSSCASLECCCEVNCCCAATNGEMNDNDDENDGPAEFKRLRQTSLHSYVKIDHNNQFLDSHCLRFMSCQFTHSNRLQFDSIIDWKRKVALEVLSNLNLTPLAKSICGQFKDKLKQSHEQFAHAIRQLEQLHLEKRKRTEQQRLNLRKCFAPKIARFALESICLKDLINHGMPKLGREIGRGQYGVVFSCNQWGGFGPLAVKSVVPPDDKHWNDLAMEFYYTKSIPENDRIVQIRGSIIDYSYGSVLLIMDRLNRDLYTAIKHGLDWITRLQIAIDVIQGIRFLHSVGLIHRDIKLKNVLLDSNNRAKISDLGFCKTTAMISGSIVGTPIHMSQEIFTGKYDQSVDVYAFGILFWYICAGHVRLPYVFEQCQNKDQLWTYVRKGSRPERLPYFDSKCWEIMNDCWRSDPHERPLPGDVEIALNQVLARYQNVEQQRQQAANRQLDHFFRSISCNAQQAQSIRTPNRNLVNSPINSPSSNCVIGSEFSPTLMKNSPLCRMNGMIHPSCSTTNTTTADEQQQSTLFDQQYNRNSINVKN